MSVTFLTNNDEERLQHRLTGPGAPDLSTAGAVGEFYMDTQTGAIYKCIKADKGVYTWELVTINNGIVYLDPPFSSETLPDYFVDFPDRFSKTPYVGAMVFAYDTPYIVTEVAEIDPDAQFPKANVRCVRVSGESGSGGTTSDGAVLYTEQELSDEQKAQARKNIGADSFDTIATVTPTINLFNKNAPDIERGKYLDIDGSYKENAYRFATGFIPCEYGKYYTTLYSTKTFGTVGRIWMYDEEKNLLGVWYVHNLESTVDTALCTFTPNYPNAAYFRFNYVTGLIDALMVVEGNIYPDEYIPYTESVLYSIDAEHINSPLKGKIISFNGDSICYGAGHTGGYGKIIALKCDMIYENIAVSGATVMYVDDTRHCISRTVANMRADADYIILEGGVNDLYDDRPLGTLSNGYNTTLDDTTFYGAFENMLKQALIRFPGKKIGYIAVHKMGTYGIGDNNAYTAAIECCKKWGIPVCDLNISCPPFAQLSLNTDTKFLADTYTKDGDGWHPNEAGYKAYYTPKIEAWLNTL